MKLTDFWKNCAMAPAGEGTAPAADPAPVEPAVQAPSFDWVPESYRSDDGPKWDEFKSHYNDLAAEKAIREEAMAGIPESADGYELAIPDDLDYDEMELPEGYSVDIDPENETLKPIFGDLRGFMHEHKLPPEAGKALMGMLARYEATTYSEGFSRAKEDFAKLGPSASQRVERIERRLDTSLPADLATALKAATGTADGVRALEKILSTKEATAPSTAQTGAAAGWENMSLSERHKEIAARQHAQYART